MAHGRAPHSSYALRVLVRREDLALVNREQVTIDYDDGSSLAIGAGVPVTDRKGRAWIQVYGVERPTTLQPQQLALSWTRAGLDPAPREFGAEPLRYPDQLSLDGQLVDPETWSWPYSDVRRWEPLLSKPELARWQFGGPCLKMELIGFTPRPDAEPSDLGGLGLVGTGRGGGGTNSAVWRIPANTALEWPDGSDAGSTRGASTRLPNAVSDDGERICYAIFGELKVCHRRDDLTLE